MGLEGSVVPETGEDRYLQRQEDLGYIVVVVQRDTDRQLMLLMLWELWHPFCTTIMCDAWMPTIDILMF